MLVDELPFVSIGLPIHNAEKFLISKLKSLTNQTIKNFEIIISDNGSTDNSEKICKEFMIQEKRIKYFKQEKNFGVMNNYQFVLNKARFEYFLWTAVDDEIFPEYIEKNLRILIKNRNIACSSSRSELFSEEKIINKKGILEKILSWYKNKHGYQDTYSAHGEYNIRLKKFFKNLRHNQIFYGLYRTDQIRTCFVSKSFIGDDAATIFNILKFGELNVINEILMRVYDQGMSRSGMLGLINQMNPNIMGKIFPYLPFTTWCWKNLNKKYFFINIKFFIEINLIGEISLLIDILRKFS